MKHSNISVFIPHTGCPNMCSFCNQHTISGQQQPPSVSEVRKICLDAYNSISDKTSCEIAFFGGSFTAVPSDYRRQLLECTTDFTGEGKFSGVRISTRPDCIDDEILRELKYYNVTAIELGCQSLDNEVLKLNNRGHNAECVKTSSELIKSYGFELGHQMMTGLYGSSPEKDIYTAEEIIKLKPDTVRIYPVVILEGTKLAELYKSGEYKTYELDDMVSLCSYLMERFQDNNIKIIKCGLHSSETVESEMIAGYYHPAFRELCESRVFRSKIERDTAFYRGAEKFEIHVNGKFISKAVGQKRSNIEYFKQRGMEIKFIQDKDLSGDNYKIFPL